MPAASDSPAGQPRLSKRGCTFALVAIILLLLLGIALGPITGSISKAKALSTMYTSRALAFALADYASAHNGRYPTGNSSTEVFQKLLDEGYITDPSMFLGGSPYLNKVSLRDSRIRLKPENVGFDITTPVDASSPDHLPVVFLTGYKIVYSPGADAVPLSSEVMTRVPSMAVGYKDDTASYFAIGSLLLPSRGYLVTDMHTGSRWSSDMRSDGTISNFMPTDFDAKGNAYRQLTPTGELPP